jgi:hypothetical protein
MALQIQALRWSRSQNPGGLLAFCYVAVFSFALQTGPGRATTWCLAGAAAVGVLAWAAALRRARAIGEQATSRIASAAQGYVEVMGRASVDTSNLIYSPMSGVQCIWYRYTVYTRDDNSKREWQRSDSGVSSATFEINDGTGACNVDPDHAEVIAPEVRTSYPDTDTKLVEELLFGGRTLYVLGEFSTIGGANSALSLREDVSALLAEWKSNPAELKRRFDLDRDGQISMAEWELARKLATSTVEQQHRAIRSQSGIHMVRAPTDGRLFLISALSPHKLRRRFVLWSGLHLGVAVAATLAMAKLWLL